MSLTPEENAAHRGGQLLLLLCMFGPTMAGAWFPDTVSGWLEVKLMKLEGFQGNSGGKKKMKKKFP